MNPVGCLHHARTHTPLKPSPGTPGDDPVTFANGYLAGSAVTSLLIVACLLWVRWRAS
jgi:hypothetical protein